MKKSIQAALSLGATYLLVNTGVVIYRFPAHSAVVFAILTVFILIGGVPTSGRVDWVRLHPIDLSVDAGVPLTASITLSGDVGALGFDIGLSGQISVDNQTIASASGVFSTLGFGICGGLGGLSIGVGDVWGDSPIFYPSGCTTTQFQVAQ